jgi:hypothetical protein
VTRRPTAWVLVLSLMLLGTTCGGESSPATQDRPSPSPQRYVSVVCTALLNWKNVIEVESSSVLMQATSLQSATAYLKGVLGVTDRLLAQVQAVGAPTAPNGPNLQSDVVHRLAAARSALLQVQVKVTTLAAQGAPDLVREVELPMLSTVESIKSKFRNPSSAELSRATVADTFCHTLFQRKAPVGTGA